ncbi:hypothetical protein [Microbacterium sp. CFBP9034]|uniref:hypothetical protein n=1 Tax=Microbacterium sp. CFBP9034 TaxID=3096540 RepID=UPI002A6A89BE|nr:hypothetical protein [Microbacterium sp. CFBP9034]MDY0910454.1 hypothetical protein [Microbacterium sp. CFBP9034]
MDRIHYAGDSILTGTAIAHALIDYAQALAQVGASATVDVPIRNEDGSMGRSEILIGPASQLIASEEKSRFDEVRDEVLVKRMKNEAEQLRHHGSPSPAAETTHREDIETWTDYEL